MMKYFSTRSSIAFLDEGHGMDWRGWGFSVLEVADAMSQGFQQPDRGKMLTLLPIDNEELLRERLKELGESVHWKIINEDEAIAERDSLKVLNDAAEEKRRNIPSDEDIFRAQQLLLLTQINAKVGGTSNV